MGREARGQPNRCGICGHVGIRSLGKGKTGGDGLGRQVGVQNHGRRSLEEVPVLSNKLGREHFDHPHVVQCQVEAAHAVEDGEVGARLLSGNGQGVGNIDPGFGGLVEQALPFRVVSHGGDEDNLGSEASQILGHVPAHASQRGAQLAGRRASRAELIPRAADDVQAGRANHQDVTVRLAHRPQVPPPSQRGVTSVPKWRRTSSNPTGKRRSRSPLTSSPILRTRSWMRLRSW